MNLATYIEIQASRSWIGVDLDKTLAYLGDDEEFDPNKIGKPIKKTVDLVKKLLSKGNKIKIFTARGIDKSTVDLVQQWCKKNIGQKLDVTDRKDQDMIKLIDDKAIGIEENTGVLKAGGPGSGCTKGSGCGPTPSGKNWLKMSPSERESYLKEHTQIGDKPKDVVKPKASPAEKIYPHSGKGSMGVGKHADVKQEERLGKITGPAGKPPAERGGNAPAPFYRKSMSKEEVEKEKAGQAEMRQWKELHQPSKRTDTNILKGDEVKTTKITKAFDNEKLEFKNFKPGTTLTVLNVLDKVGNNPQMLAVQYPGRQGDIVHMPVTDVRLHRPYEGIQEKPAWQIRQEIGLDKTNVRPGKIAQQVTTPSGATYTKLKEEKAGRPTGSGNVGRPPLEWKQGQPSPNPHPLKGEFELAKGPRGNKLNDIFTFDTNLKSFGQGTARATVYDASYKVRSPQDIKEGTSGTTVIAWRDTTNKTGKVVEFNKDRNGFIKLGSQPPVSFKNIGHMSSYLNQRFGISMKLPGSSVAKRKR
jgi:hypothetical protein